MKKQYNTPISEALPVLPIAFVCVSPDGDMFYIGDPADADDGR